MVAKFPYEREVYSGGPFVGTSVKIIIIISGQRSLSSSKKQRID
jgi:hypothetical protein